MGESRKKGGMKGKDDKQREPAEQTTTASSAGPRSHSYNPSELRNMSTVESVTEPERHQLFIAQNRDHVSFQLVGEAAV